MPKLLPDEFLIPLSISTYKLSKDIAIPQTILSQIFKGKRRITADVALRRSKYFGNSPKSLLGFQNDFDFDEASLMKKTALKAIKAFHWSAA